MRRAGRGFVVVGLLSAALLAAGVVAVLTNAGNASDRLLAASDRPSKELAAAASRGAAPGMPLADAVAHLAPRAWRYRRCEQAVRSEHAFYFGTRDEQLKAGILVVAAGPPGAETVTEKFGLFDEMNRSKDYCPVVPLPPAR